MVEVKQDRDTWVPVRLFTTNGDGLPFVRYTDVTASVVLQDKTVIVFSPASSSWNHVNAGYNTNLGLYQLKLTGSAVATTGSMMYTVSAGPYVPAVPFVGNVSVVAQEAADVVQTVLNVSASLGGAIERLRVVSEGRWKIDTATNKMTFYTLADPTVPFLVFGISGSDGSPNTTSPFERRPTS